MQSRRKERILGKSKGVTLIELIIVIIIITTLALLVVPRFMGRTEEARRAAALADIKTGLGTALEMFETDTGNYPAQLEDLLEDPGVPNWRGPYLKDASQIPNDPWGNPYIYQSPGTNNPHSYDLFSYGRDGKPGGEGYDEDIGNW